MKYFILMFILMLIGCTNTNTGSLNIGYWKDTYPHNVSEWQCIESFKPHRNKEC